MQVQEKIQGALEKFSDVDPDSFRSADPNPDPEVYNYGKSRV